MGSRTRDMALVSLTVALTTAGAFLRIPAGPVPISLQTLFVLISGAILGPWLGALAMVAYILLGLIGLPVFTGGGGPGYVLSPTFGFLLSFPLAAMTVGLLARAGSSPAGGSRSRDVAALVAGTAVIYLVGVPWLGLNLKIVQGKDLGLRALLMIGMIPFLPGDALKVLLASLLLRPLRRAVSRQGRG
ncbi:MAG: biotin transporter BioY [bacterium]|nr:MAG: biotin transporter BioY [bacterium]